MVHREQVVALHEAAVRYVVLARRAAVALREEVYSVTTLSTRAGPMSYQPGPNPGPNPRPQES